MNNINYVSLGEKSNLLAKNADTPKKNWQKYATFPQVFSGISNVVQESFL